jgi:hypothetical protein
MEVTQRQTAAHFVERQHLLRTQTLFTLQLFAFVGDLACFLLRFDYVERVASSRCTVQAQYQGRCRRTSLLHALVTLIEHSLHLTVAGTRQHDVAHFQGTVGNEYRSHIATTLIQ